MLWSILQRDLFTKFVWLEDEMVWNLMECRKFEVHSDCRASRTPIGAMFPWSPKGHVLQRFSAQDCSFRKEFLDLKVTVYWVTFKLGFLEHFFFSAPCVFDAFLLSLFGQCGISDDLMVL